MNTIKKGHIARVKFSNDKSASQKQRDYLAGLLEQKQYAAGSLPEPTKNFFQQMEVPADLTAWEASSLIDLFNTTNPAGIVQELVRTITRRQNGEKIYDTSKGAALFAFEKATLNYGIHINSTMKKAA